MKLLQAMEPLNVLPNRGSLAVGVPRETAAEQLALQVWTLCSLAGARREAAVCLTTSLEELGSSGPGNCSILAGQLSSTPPCGNTAI